MAVDAKQAERDVERREFRLLDLGAIVLDRWKVVLGVVGVAVMMALAITVLQPQRYTARTVLLVSQEQGGGRAQLIALQSAALGIPALSGTSSTQNLINAILRSRALKDTILSRVASGASAETVADLQRILGRHTRTQSSTDGTITVEVTSRDAQRAALIANEFSDAINLIVAGISAQAAVRRHHFLEAQLVRAREQLLESEQRLVSFQQGQAATPQTDAAADRTLEVAARLQQEIIAQELHVAQLARTLTQDNPEYRAAIADLSARRDQLRRLTSGGGTASLFVPLRESPQLRISTVRLLRELEKDQEIYKSLTAAAAEAQIAANNNLPVVSVLDPATRPSPRGGNLGLILAVWTVTGVLVGLAVAFIGEYLRRVRQDPESEPLIRAWDRFKSDVRRTLPRRNKTGVARDAA